MIDIQTLADVVEAILGAAYLSVGFPGVYIATQSLAIPVLEYDAASEVGKKMLPEPPAGISPPLKPGTVQTLEGIIGHKFKRRYYLEQVLVRGSTSVVGPSIFNVVTWQANKTVLQYQSTSCERLGFIGDGILDFRESLFYALRTFV